MAVGCNGYCWWCLDGLSDNGRHGVTVIVSIGSMFLPYYAAAAVGRRLKDTPFHARSELRAHLCGVPVMTDPRV